MVHTLNTIFFLWCIYRAYSSSEFQGNSLLFAQWTVVTIMQINPQRGNKKQQNSKKLLRWKMLLIRTEIITSYCISSSYSLFFKPIVIWGKKKEVFVTLPHPLDLWTCGTHFSYFSVFSQWEWTLWHTPSEQAEWWSSELTLPPMPCIPHW